MLRSAPPSLANCDCHRGLGISIVYITHDLTTAFQICDNIMVLCRGAVAEAGAVEGKLAIRIISQLLVSSIPLPNLDETFGGGGQMRFR